jgi:hypothetical protein
MSKEFRYLLILGILAYIAGNITAEIIRHYVKLEMERNNR